MPADDVDLGVADAGPARNVREALEAKIEGYGFSLGSEGRPRAAGAAPAATIESNAGKIAATFEKGILEIHAPKAKEAIPQRIPIKKRA